MFRIDGSAKYVAVDDDGGLEDRIVAGPIVGCGSIGFASFGNNLVLAKPTAEHCTAH